MQETIYHRAAQSLLVLGLCLAGITAVGSDDADPVSGLPLPPQQVVCRWQQDIGSHIRRKICRTRAEEELAQAEARQVLREMRVSGGPGGNRRINGVFTGDGTTVRN